jgi:hypothetical protein
LEAQAVTGLELRLGTCSEFCGGLRRVMMHLPAPGGTPTDSDMLQGVDGEAPAPHSTPY